MSSNIEFAVQMTCNSCVEAVKRTLNGVKGIKSFSVDLDKQQVIVNTTLPVLEVQELIENSGRKAVLKGYGAQMGEQPHSAVAMLSGGGALGVVRFVQLGNQCIVDGTIDGLSPGEHGLHVHEFGDISNGCLSVGNHYNPHNKAHGGQSDENRHLGDLGNVLAKEDGRAAFRFEDKLINVPDIIGRSLVVTTDKDDLGRGLNENSKLTGNSGEGLACGIIARSAGILENPKRVCLCDGRTIWDENVNAENEISKRSTVTGLSKMYATGDSLTTVISFANVRDSLLRNFSSLK